MKMELISLALENFKCFESRTFRFDGRDADISGENGTGKSSVYDAFTWLLFGKNGAGESLTEGVKPVFTGGEHEGQVRDHGAVTSVEAELRVDGAPRTLRRTYYEVWSVKRGSGEATRDGHSSDYYVDGVPVKKNEFARRVGELVDEKAFRLLTSVTYFAQDLPWKERRAALFDLTRVADDRELMAGDARFAPLAESIGDLMLEDYRKILDAKRKGLNKTRNDTPARLDECKKTVTDLSGIDFPALELQKTQAQERRAAVQRELDQVEHDGGRTERQNRLAAIQNERGKLENENAAYRLAQEQTRGADETAQLRQNLNAIRTQESRRQRDLAYLRQRKDALESEVTACRASWESVNAERFQGGNCPTCGQPLPKDRLAEAKETFRRSVTSRKKDAVDAANRAKTTLAGVQMDIDRLEQENSADAKQAETLENQLRQAENAPRVEITDMVDYASRKAALTAQADALQREIGDMTSRSAVRRGELRDRLAHEDRELERLSGELAKKTALRYAETRMDNLRAEAAAAADELNRVDKMIALCEAFTRYKAKFIEDSVNLRFDLVKFRLFRDQINGGIEDCCDVMVGGVDYNDTLNTGAKVRAGVDIINTLSRHYGVSVPLFLDGAESVTGPLEASTQTIRLRVAEGEKELRCELK